MYENSISCCDEVKQLEPRATLTELMSIAKGMGGDALNMARVISKHFFYDNKDITQGKRETSCFMDVMDEHCDTLRELCDVLAKMVDALGCPR